MRRQSTRKGHRRLGLRSVGAVSALVCEDPGCKAGSRGGESGGRYEIQLYVSSRNRNWLWEAGGTPLSLNPGACDKCCHCGGGGGGEPTQRGLTKPGIACFPVPPFLHGVKSSQHSYAMGFSIASLDR